MNPIELNYDISHCQLYNAVAEIEHNPTIKIFPTPTERSLQIESEIPIKHVTIYFFWQICQKAYFENTCKVEINVEELPKGIYFFQINDSKKYIKILIQKFRQLPAIILLV